MNIRLPRFRHFAFFLTLLSPLASAQFFPAPLGSGPWVFNTFEQDNVKLSVIARGINEPIGMVFVPGTATTDNPLGDILVTERRSGQVRLVRNGVLQAEPAGDLNPPYPLANCSISTSIPALQIMRFCISPTSRQVNTLIAPRTCA